MREFYWQLLEVYGVSSTFSRCKLCHIAAHYPHDTPVRLPNDTIRSSYTGTL